MNRTRSEHHGKEQDQVQAMRRQVAGILARPYGCVVFPGPDGRIRAKLESVGGRKVLHEYAYDAAGRLATVRRDGAETERYAYDERGRRSRDWNPQRGNAGRDLVYGPDDRLLRAGEASFAHDAMGRLQRRHEPGRQDMACNYSPLGFLSDARTPDLRFIGFERDGDERRIAKLVNNKKVEGYGWDRQERLAWHYDVRAEAASWFRNAEDGRLPLALDRGTETFFLGWDQVGSLRAVVDAQGQVVKEIAYDAFGNILKETNPEWRIPFGFAGGLHDRDLGMVSFRFRDYVPDVGRFSAKDPIGYKGGDADLYGYCLDDPVNGVDPKGLQQKSNWGDLKEGVRHLPDAWTSLREGYYSNFPEPGEETFGDRMRYWSQSGSKRGVLTDIIGGLISGNPLNVIPGGFAGGVLGAGGGALSGLLIEGTSLGDEAYWVSRNAEHLLNDAYDFYTR